MKYIIAFLALITFICCQAQVPVHHAIPAEEAFVEIKKSILECIIKSDKASQELKNYAVENVNNGYKETLLLSNFRNNESDRLVIRQCRRQAFLNTSKKRIKPLPLVPKEQIKPKVNN